jgi:predicted TIM-barrel fold metal-dependent hydrolase
LSIIDFRVRPPYKGYLDTLMYSDPVRRDRFTRQLGLQPSIAATRKSCELLIQEMDEAGVDIGVVVGRNSGFLGSVSNETVKEFVAAFPMRFVGVASIGIEDRKVAIQEISEARAEGFVAITIEPGAAPVPVAIDDRRLYPLYAECEGRCLPLILLAGGNAGPDLSATSPEALDRVLADFPNLKIAAAHGGWPWVNQILQIAIRRQNLFISPDMYLIEMPGMLDYIKAANGFLADRFIYGSSFPLCPIGGYLRWFQGLPIRDAVKERILYRNALDFLKLDSGLITGS